MNPFPHPWYGPALVNLSPEPAEAEVPHLGELATVAVDGYGFRWLRGHR